MSDYKRQHYVPRFYLRLFSSDRNFIYGFNIKQNKFFHGPIQTACADPYFYSKDSEIEKSLGPLEAKVSELISRVITTKTLPTTLEDRFFVYSFMMLQHGRTAAAKDSAKEMTAKQSEMITTAFKTTDFKLVWGADHLYSMLVAFTATPLIIDLTPVLLINNTKKRFITSDNPVVLHNTCFNAIKTHGTKGYQSRGLQIFWPVSSSLAIMFYDPECYTVLNSNGKEVEVNSEKDILALNALQYLYCRETVIFESNEDEDQINWMNDVVKPLRKEKTQVRKKYPHPFKPNSEIHHFYDQNLDFDLQLSFIDVKKGALSGVRNKENIEKFNDFFNRIMEHNKKKS